MVTSIDQADQTKRIYNKGQLTIIIDFGNGFVKVLIKQGSNSDWMRLTFPSIVAESAGEEMSINGVKYVIGDKATEYTCMRTGNTPNGKVENALPVLVESIGKTVGWTRDYAANIIFSCPSVKDYGDAIKDKLRGEHTIIIHGQELLGEENETYTLTVDKMSAQLECHLAYRLKTTPKKRRYLVDIGSRTLIINVIGPDNRIEHRNVIDACGVWPMLERIREGELLSGVKGLKRLPNEQDIANFLYGLELKPLKRIPNKASDSTRSKLIVQNKEIEANNELVRDVIARIEPAVMGCLSNAIAYIERSWQPNDELYLLGGGAKLCGLKQLLPHDPKLISKEPVWATVDALAQESAVLLSKASS